MSFLFHPRRRIDAYLAHGLSPAAEARLRAHLARCEGCRRQYDLGVLALRAARGSLEAFGEGELERLARRAARVDAPVAASGRPLRWVLALAPVAAVAIAVVVFVPWARPLGSVAQAGARLLVDGRPAEVGDALGAFARVEAVEGSSRLELTSGKAVVLQAGARVVLADSSANVHLEQGAAQFWVSSAEGKNPFEVRAGDCRVVVEGTVFAVERALDEVHVAVDEGRVRVEAAAGGQSVGPGQRTVVRKGRVAPPRPSPLGGTLLERLMRRGDKLLDDWFP